MATEYSENWRCSECGSKLENHHDAARDSWCSHCWSQDIRRIWDEAGIEDGDIVRYDKHGTGSYDGDMWYAEIGPEIYVFLYPTTADPDDHSISDKDSEWPIIRSVQSVEHVTLRYEVRCADERVCDPAESDGVFHGFDDYGEAAKAAKAWSRANDLAYSVWDVKQERFVYSYQGDDVVRKDEPAVENPLEPSDDLKAEIRREEHMRSAAYERRYGHPDA